MARDSSDSQGCSGWFKWLVGIVIALLAAGGGIVALLNYFEGQEQQKRQQYQVELERWNTFSPSSISKGPQDATLRGLDRIDLETGLVSSNPSSNRQWDLLFGCWPESYESLRALDGVTWFEKGVADFQAIMYREIRDAGYEVRRNATTGYNDLYYAHMSNVPGEDYIFYIRTPEGNVAKLQIIGYELVDNNPLVCRNMKIRYDVFPVVSDPPRPNPPN
jgi:hypothetical protein